MICSIIIVKLFDQELFAFFVCLFLAVIVCIFVLLPLGEFKILLIFNYLTYKKVPSTDLEVQ